MSKTNLSTLEAELLKFKTIIDDIEAVYHCELLYEDTDSMQNALLGLLTLGQVKFDRVVAELNKVKKNDN